MRLIVAFCAFAAIGAAADEPLLLQKPTLSKTHIVFVYAGDLWSVPREGGDAIRLTSGTGDETDPAFSPDGNRIAFTGEYDGNVDVFVVPPSGGVPKRLTWHPAPDRVLGWTPDGKRVIFSSARTAYRVLAVFVYAYRRGKTPEALLEAWPSIFRNEHPIPDDITKQAIDGREIEVHFAGIRRPERCHFQVDNDEAPELQVVEEQIDLEILAPNFERHLAADESETNSELNEKLAEVGEQPPFKVALLCFLGEVEKVEVVGVFDELLGEIGCGDGRVARKFVIAFPWRR